jgi:hypothetical protein
MFHSKFSGVLPESCLNIAAIFLECRIMAWRTTARIIELLLASFKVNTFKNYFLIIIIAFRMCGQAKICHPTGLDFFKLRKSRKTLVNFECDFCTSIFEATL